MPSPESPARRTVTPETDSDGFEVGGNCSVEVVIESSSGCERAGQHKGRSIIAIWQFQQARSPFDNRLTESLHDAEIPDRSKIVANIRGY